MYGWEKFHLASEGLKKSEQNPRQALEDAYVYHILHISDHDVPEEVLGSLHRIQSAVTLPEGVDPIGGNGGCKYAISLLSEEEVEMYIQQIHETYALINARQGKNT